MLARAMIVVAIVAGSAHAEPLHRDAIPAGDGWWCMYAAASGISTCMRTEEKCTELVNRMGMIAAEVQERGRAAGVDVPQYDTKPCEQMHDIWVRTGQEPSGEWRYLAAPAREACEHSPAWDLGNVHQSACERWHENDGPPDAAIVPAGTGWWCTDASICLRAKDACAIVAQLSQSRACKPAKKAFVFTSRGRFDTFGTAGACESAREADVDASRCAAQ